MPPAEEVLMTTGEVASLLRVSRRAVLAMARPDRDGQVMLPPIKLRAGWRFKRTAVEALINGES